MSRAEPSPADRLLLAAIALGAALPMVYMGVQQRIDYDGWWHVFIARATPWAQFWRDVHDNAHPPAFYLLLRAAAWLGSERIVYRAISIAAAVVATYLIGRLAARLLRTPRLAPLCALAFGLSMSTVVMACSVRSYMLSVALLLVAVGHWLALIDPRREAGRATRIWFAAALSGAIATNYSAVFVAVAAATLPLLYAAVDAPYRRWLGERLGRDGRADLATAAPIAAVVLAIWAAHVADFPFMHHTAQFELGAAEAAEGLGAIGSFLARVVIAEIQLFAPLPLAALPAAARAAVVALLIGIAAGLWIALWRRADWPTAEAPLAIAALVAGQMMLAALLGRYPFGGYLRHQYVLFPFLVLAGFALIDELVDRLRRPRLALAAVAAGVVLSSAAQWRLVHLVDVEPLGFEVAQFAELFPDSGAVYVDRFSLIPLIAAQQRRPWADQVEVGPNLVAVPVGDGERTLLVVRDMRRWSADLRDPALYRDLRALLDRTGLPAVDVFRLRQDAHLLPSDPRATRIELADSVIGQASAAGLRAERLVLDGLHVYIRLRPAGTGGT